MRPARWRAMAAVALILPLLLTGCWDSREINQLFILTGIALDVSEQPGQIDVAAQVAKIKQGEAGSGESGGGGDGDSTILLTATSKTVLGCISAINRDSDHKLLFQHNQIRLFGIALAEQGIQQHLDVFLRDQQARQEVPLAVVDGRAEEALAAKLSQGPISGIFLGGMFEDLAQVSVKNRARLIDFIHGLMDETTAEVMPIIKVTGEEDRQEIKLAGMAVFKDGRMTGRLSNEEVLGYLWSLGGVQRSNVEVTDAASMAVLHITKLDCEREVTLGPDGGISVVLKVHSLIGIGELVGFQEMKPPELLKRLEALAEEEIKAKIAGCFTAAQGLGADIFGYGTMVYQKYPQEWEAMKDRWDALFQEIALQVEVQARIPGTGLIVQSLEMEEAMK